jgi:aminoglycoside 3-N-acetyltransferase
MLVSRLRRALGDIKRSMDRRTLSEAEFRALLIELGVVPGTIGLIHSSMDVLKRRVPTLSATRLISILQEAVGESGTLLMPSLPFSGLQKPYIEKGLVFDVRKTPSQSGLLTEVFRRVPGVVRSSHPVASVAAWGRRALELVGDHVHGSSFGPTSPYARVAALGGLEIGLGTPAWGSFSLFHVIEELDPVTQAYCFETVCRGLLTVDGNVRLEVPVVPLRADRHRDFQGLERLLRSEGVIRIVTRGGLECRVANGDALVKRGLELAREGRFLFGRKAIEFAGSD